MSKKKAVVSPLVLFLSVILLCAGGYAGYWKLLSWLPSSERVPFAQYHGIDGIYIVLEDKLVTAASPPFIKDGAVFLPVDFVAGHIDKYVFWEPEADRLTITDDYNVIRLSASGGTPLRNIGGQGYISAGFLTERYGLDITLNAACVTVDRAENAKRVSRVVSKTANVRFEPNKKSPIAETLEMGAEVLTYQTEGDYTLVRTEGGAAGYVLAKQLAFEREEAGVIPEPAVPYVHKPVADNGRINLIWEQVFKAPANPATRVLRDGLDVLSPTWFLLNSDMSGRVDSIADLDYVNWAHENGMSVWALLGADWNDDIGIVLRDPLKREYLVEQLMGFIDTYKLDGINVDFETVTSADGKYFTQLLRELAPHMKARGTILSVDMYVPKPHNLHYNRTEAAICADYIIIMGYDEYWRTSPVSGPVASIGFVEEGIIETLKEVPKEKVILGVPYYNRIWTDIETEAGITASANDYGMTYPYNYFTENGAEFVWDDETKTYYAELHGTENGQPFTKKVWLEDERSLEEKLKLAVKYDLAGVAGWKKGLEKESVWELLYSYLK